jgi:hypothetical protein
MEIAEEIILEFFGKQSTHLKCEHQLQGGNVTDNLYQQDIIILNPLVGENRRSAEYTSFIILTRLSIVIKLFCFYFGTQHFLFPFPI